MRRVGRISSWNDEKGYGFVVPHDGGERAFVHIKAFELASRRPIDGDLISYSISKDDRGRPNATAIRFAGQKNVGRHFGSRSEERAGPRLPWPVPRLMIGSLSLVAITCGAILGDVPVVILLAYFIASSLSYIFYALDKMYAGKRMWRVPEQLLHIVDLLCGWPGALIAQQQFRHKTAKKSFQSMFWTTVVFNAAAVAWLMNSETARALIQALVGR